MNLEGFRSWKEISKGVLQEGGNHGNLTGCHHTETVSVFISNWALSVLFSTGYESRENGAEMKNPKYVFSPTTH